MMLTIPPIFVYYPDKQIAILELQKQIIAFLDEAKNKHMESIIFTGQGTGRMGNPKDDVARISIKTAMQWAAKDPGNIGLIRIMVRSEDGFEIFKE